MKEASLLCPTCARPVEPPPEHHGLWHHQAHHIRCEYCNRSAPLADAQKMAQAYLLRCRQFCMQIEAAVAGLPVLSNAEAVEIVGANQLEEKIHYVRNLEELGYYACESFRHILRECVLGPDQPQLKVERLQSDGADQAVKIYGHCRHAHPPTTTTIEALNFLAASVTPSGYLIHITAADAGHDAAEEV